MKRYFMNRNRILSSGLVAAASFSMLAACSPTETPTTPSPNATATATPVPVAIVEDETDTPDATATATPAPVASATATPAPVASATATPAPVATATPDPNATTAPTAQPLPSSQEDISVVEKTTFNGKVYDDTNAPLDGVLVKAMSLNSSVPYEAETTTAGGTYAFNNAPAGDTYAGIQAALNAQFTTSPVTVTEVSNAAGGAVGTVDPGDTYRIRLAEGAIDAAKTGTTVNHITIGATDVFSSANLTGPYVIFASAADGRGDIYRPGDNVIIEADTTILDPAGNSVDSSGDDVSANAS